MVLNILQTHLRVGGSSGSALLVSVRGKCSSTFGQHTARGPGERGGAGDSTDDDDDDDDDGSADSDSS